VNLEQLGLFGVFLGGAVPWIEAVDVIYKPQESEPFRFCDELETGCNPRIED
jgi:hypothetical protein